MNGLALFAGIGGLELGLHLAVPGYRTVCHVERDAYAAATLVARMEDAALDPAPIWDDVSTFDGRPWRGVVDCVSGGFPCQDISVAGSGAGLDGEQSGLWSEYARIVREVRPRFVFVENVPALATRGLDRVLGDLAALGFDAEWDVFSAAGVGAPHLRRRIFILARRVPDALGDALRQESRGRGRSRDGRSEAQPGHMGEALADRGRREGERVTERAGQRRASGDDPDGHDPHGGLRWPPGPGDDDGWRDWIAAGGPEPAVRRGADGTAYRMDRLRCLGNGVVPAVAARAWRELSRRLGA